MAAIKKYNVGERKALTIGVEYCYDILWNKISGGTSAGKTLFSETLKKYFLEKGAIRSCMLMQDDYKMGLEEEG